MEPQGLPPTKAPPPPPESVPLPPESTSQAQAPAGTEAEDGQWIDTSPYGWVWMPYGDEFVYTPNDVNAQPYAYVYYPGGGWRWIVAPWIWGIGPIPYFGVGGPWRFHWYRGPAYHPRAPDRPLFRGGYRAPSSGSRASGKAGGHSGKGR